MKRAWPAVLVLMLLLLGWTAWRVAALSDEVARLSSAPVPEPASHEAPSAMSDAPPPAPPSLEAPMARLGAPDPGLEARMAAIEKKIADMAARWNEAAAERKMLMEALAEFTAEKIGSLETAAVSVSRNVISAQAQFQQSAKVDVDGDRTGEYGGFLEMSGGEPGRMAAKLLPPVLSGAFRKLTPGGEVPRNGYLYRVFLPDARGTGVGEPPSGFDRVMVHSDLSETTWCLYAWPEVYGKTGTRTFFTNQGGDVLATEAAAYSGSGSGPSADAAFVRAGTITGPTAIGRPGSDGNVWKQVN